MAAKRLPLDPLALTRPENAVELRDGRKVVERVVACGGCFCCKRRDPRTEMFHRALCGKVIPAQFMQSGCEFDPDYDRIYSRENTA